MSQGVDVICYLCGQGIENTDAKNKDHVIIKQFVQRKQPMQKGFFYGGMLPTHKCCNRKFGDLGQRTESMCKQAVRLLSILTQLKSMPHPNDRRMPLVLIDRDKFKEFDSWHPKELAYFGITELRARRDQYMNPAFFQSLDKVAPLKKPINISLSVLAKSAAAYLVKFQEISPTTSWHIDASLMHSAEGDIDPQGLAQNVSEIKLLDRNLYLYGKHWDNGDWSVFYIVRDIMAIFHFSFADDNAISDWQKVFPDNHWWRFRSKTLIDLVGHDWTSAQIG